MYWPRQSNIWSSDIIISTSLRISYLSGWAAGISWILILNESGSDSVTGSWFTAIWIEYARQKDRAGEQAPQLEANNKHYPSPYLSYKRVSCKSTSTCSHLWPERRASELDRCAGPPAEPTLNKRFKPMIDSWAEPLVQAHDWHSGIVTARGPASRAQPGCHGNVGKWKRWTGDVPAQTWHWLLLGCLAAQAGVLGLQFPAEWPTSLAVPL